MDPEWKQGLQQAQEKIEAIGFFAAIGMHFSESTPLLSEDLGDHVKGTPWERFSSIDQCLKMIHELAAKAWRNLENIAALVEPQIGEEKDPEREMINQEETILLTGLPSQFQSIAGEVILLKTMGESIVALAEDGKQVRELDHSQVKSLGEMIINAAITINKNLQEQKEKINQEDPRREMEKQKAKPLALIREEMSSIKAFGSSLAAMGTTSQVNPRQIETIGQLIVNLADKVTEKLNGSSRGAVF
ncbi:MAG: hypothetical protein AB1424_17570 [Thermodesulfobacteriota bacterium]